jgi:hypothetical protein
MNPLILLFIKTFSLPFYLDMELRGGDLAFISQTDIADSVSVYTVYRDILKVDLHLR